MSQQLYVRDAEYGLTIPILLGDAGEVTITAGDDPLVTIDIVHDQIHEGNVYLATYIDDSVVADAVVDISIVTGADDGEENHAFFRAAAGGDAMAYLYENVTCSGGATAALVNRNRICGKTLGTQVLVYSGVSCSISGAVLLKQKLLPGGTAFSMGAETEETNGWVLQCNTTYLYRVHNITAAAEPMAVGVTIVHKAF